MFVFKYLNIRLEKEELFRIYKRGRSCFKREEIGIEERERTGLRARSEVVPRQLKV